MRPSLWVLACAGFLAGGCASNTASVCRCYQARWESVCRQMRSLAGHAGPFSQAPTHLPPKQAKPFEAVARRVATSIVHVKTSVRFARDPISRGDGARQTALPSGGTGVVIGPQGVILTNEHVVRGAETIVIVLADGAEHPVERVITDPTLDLALLKIKGQALQALQLAPQAMHVGLPVVALGRTNAHQPIVSRVGWITDPNASLQQQLDPHGKRRYAPLIESTTQLEPGCSGGPLLDSQGRLIGLNVAVANGSEGRRGYAIPLDPRVCHAIQRLMQRAE